MSRKNDEYLTVKEVAERTGLSTVKLYTIINYDRLGSEMIGERIIIPKKVLEEWEKTNIKPKEKEDDKKKKK